MSAPMPAPSHRPVLTQADLGRATLARQALLEPASGDVVSAIERFGGLQAQEAASPFVALWTRLDGFAAADLQAAFLERRVVKATMMRSTLHAVSAADYGALQPAVSPMLQPIRRQDRSRAPDPDHLDRLARIAAVHTAEPRTLGELRDHLASDAGTTDLSPDEIVWWLRRHMTFIHVPDETAPWAFGRRPRIVEAGSWLPELAFEDQAAAGVHLVRRYLGAFGPATPADISAWSGVAVGRLRPSLAALDASGELWHARDERGRALVDLVDAPRPPGGTPAPPRLLAMWDSVLLAHQDRTRIISDADRAQVIARNGDTLATFLVDGRVAGTWWAEVGPGGRTRIAVEPFREVDVVAMRSLKAQADGLAAFVEPLEPLVYSRYQRWRPRQRADAS